MPVYHGNKEVEVKWVRYGGIESDETLDVMDFYMFAEWDSDRGIANGDLIPYVRDKVNEIKLEDIGMMLPSDSYIVIWDKYRNSIDFSEYLSRAKYVFTPTEECSFLNIVVKGHDFKYTYEQHTGRNEWKTYNGFTYYPFVTYKKSSKPGVTPEKIIRIYGIAFKGTVSINENDLKTLVLREYMNYICKDMEDTVKIPLINTKMGLIHTNFDNVKEVCKNFRIERGVN